MSSELTSGHVTWKNWHYRCVYRVGCELPATPAQPLALARESQDGGGILPDICDREDISHRVLHLPTLSLMTVRLSTSSSDSSSNAANSPVLVVRRPGNHLRFTKPPGCVMFHHIFDARLAVPKEAAAVLIYPSGRKELNSCWSTHNTRQGNFSQTHGILERFHQPSSSYSFFFFNCQWAQTRSVASCFFLVTRSSDWSL